MLPDVTGSKMGESAIWGHGFQLVLWLRSPAWHQGQVMNCRGNPVSIHMGRGETSSAGREGGACEREGVREREREGEKWSGGDGGGKGGPWTLLFSRQKRTIFLCFYKYYFSFENLSIIFVCFLFHKWHLTIIICFCQMNLAVEEGRNGHHSGHPC